MLLHILPDNALIFVIERVQAHHFAVHLRGKRTIDIIHISHPARHTGGKILACLSEYNHQPARHVFEAVVAYALYHDFGPGVTYPEPFTGHTPDISLARCCAIERHVTDDAVFFRFKQGRAVGINNQFGTAEAFSEVVVGITFQFQTYPGGGESPETLTCRSSQLNVNGIRWQLRPGCDTNTV